MFSTKRFCDYYPWEVVWCFDHERLRDLIGSSVKIGLQQCRKDWHSFLHLLHILTHILLYSSNKLQKSTSTTIPRFAVKSLGKPRMGIVWKFILNNICKTGWCKKLSVRSLCMFVSLFSCHRLSHRARIFKTFKEHKIKFPGINSAQPMWFGGPVRQPYSLLGS